MKHLGSSKNFDESFMRFKKEILKIYDIIPSDSNFYVMDFLLFSKKIIESDRLIEDYIEKFEEIYNFDNILDEFVEYFKNFKDIKKSWNIYNLWLLFNIFVYFWKDTICYFQKDKFEVYISELNNIWDDIQILINKWKTDFLDEFVLGTSFLLTQEKSEYLDYMKILSQKFENTKYSNMVENIINLVSINEFSLDLFNPPDNYFEFHLCLILILLRFGNSTHLRIFYKQLNSIIKNLWSDIVRKKDKIEVYSFIRDWLSARYVELLVLKNLELTNTIPEVELNYFSISPRRFERLVFWIIKKSGKWKNVQWRGASGSEKGKDIFALKKENNRVWIIQVKRTKNFGSSNLRNEFLKVKSELKKFNSEGYSIFIAKNATDKLREMGEELSKEFKYKIKIKDNSDLDFIVKQSNILLKEFFNYSF